MQKICTKNEVQKVKTSNTSKNYKGKVQNYIKQQQRQPEKAYFTPEKIIVQLILDTLKNEESENYNTSMLDEFQNSLWEYELSNQLLKKLVQKNSKIQSIISSMLMIADGYFSFDSKKMITNYIKMPHVLKYQSFFIVSSSDNYFILFQVGLHKSVQKSDQDVITFGVIHKVSFIDIFFYQKAQEFTESLLSYQLLIQKDFYRVEFDQLICISPKLPQKPKDGKEQSYLFCFENKVWPESSFRQNGEVLIQYLPLKFKSQVVSRDLYTLDQYSGRFIDKLYFERWRRFCQNEQIANQNKYKLKQVADFQSAGFIIDLLQKTQDFKIKLSPQEREVVSTPNNALVIGRSGTGKTTSQILRIFASETFMRVRCKILGVKKLQILNDYYGRDVSIHTIFTTANSYLVKEVEKYYHKLEKQAHEAVTKHRESRTFNLDESFVSQTYSEITQYEDDILDFLQTEQFEHQQHFEKEDHQFHQDQVNQHQTIQSFSDSAFPAFFSTQLLLILLDKQMKQPFFSQEILRIYRDKHSKQIGFLDCNGINLDEHFPTRANRSFQTSLYSSQQIKQQVVVPEVDFPIFYSQFWPTVAPRLKNNQDSLSLPSLVWTQIYSYIKGSQYSHAYPNQCLPLTLYKERVENYFNLELITQIYQFFQLYEEWKKKVQYFDQMDIVNNLLLNIENGHYIHFPIHYFYIDEVQDLPQALIELFCKITEQGVMFSGDTAQCIVKGVGFRFQDLQTLFKNSKKIGANDIEKFSVYQLTTNFRSHNNILQLANCIVTILELLFPKTLDHLKKEVSNLKGPKPVFFQNLNYQDIFRYLDDKYYAEEQCEIEFGYNQVVIVKNDEAKQHLPEAIKHNALILTTFQAKGLEFDDVIIYNCFTFEPLSQYQWEFLNCLDVRETFIEKSIFDANVTKHQNEKEDYDDYEFTKDGQVKLKKLILNQRFESKKANDYSSLCNELKTFYVCVTRAKKRVLIFDDQPERRFQFEKLLLRMGVCDVYPNTKIQVQHLQQNVPVQKQDQQFVQQRQVIKPPVEKMKQETNQKQDKQFVEQQQLNKPPVENMKQETNQKQDKQFEEQQQLNKPPVENMKQETNQKQGKQFEEQQQVINPPVENQKQENTQPQNQKKILTGEEKQLWEQQGYYMFQRKVYDQAIKCFKKANNQKMEQLSKAFEEATQGSKKAATLKTYQSIYEKQKQQNIKNKIEELQMESKAHFWEAAKLFYEQNEQFQAANCYYSGEFYIESLILFLNLDQLQQAAKSAKCLQFWKLVVIIHFKMYNFEKCLKILNKKSIDRFFQYELMQICYKHSYVSEEQLIKYLQLQEDQNDNIFNQLFEKSNNINNIEVDEDLYVETLCPAIANKIDLHKMFKDQINKIISSQIQIDNDLPEMVFEQIKVFWEFYYKIISNNSIINRNDYDKLKQLFDHSDQKKDIVGKNEMSQFLIEVLEQLNQFQLLIQLFPSKKNQYQHYCYQNVESNNQFYFYQFLQQCLKQDEKANQELYSLLQFPIEEIGQSGILICWNNFFIQFNNFCLAIRNYEQSKKYICTKLNQFKDEHQFLTSVFGQKYNIQKIIENYKIPTYKDKRIKEKCWKIYKFLVKGMKNKNFIDQMLRIQENLYQKDQSPQYQELDDIFKIKDQNLLYSILINLIYAQDKKYIKNFFFNASLEQLLFISKLQTLGSELFKSASNIDEQKIMFNAVCPIYQIYLSQSPSENIVGQSFIFVHKNSLLREKLIGKNKIKFSDDLYLVEQEQLLSLLREDLEQILEKAKAIKLIFRLILNDNNFFDTFFENKYSEFSINLKRDFSTLIMRKLDKLNGNYENYKTRKLIYQIATILQVLNIRMPTKILPELTTIYEDLPTFLTFQSTWKHLCCINSIQYWLKYIFRGNKFILEKKYPQLLIHELNLVAFTFILTQNLINSTSHNNFEIDYTIFPVHSEITDLKNQIKYSFQKKLVLTKSNPKNKINQEPQIEQPIIDRIPQENKQLQQIPENYSQEQPNCEEKETKGDAIAPEMNLESDNLMEEIESQKQQGETKIQTDSTPQDMTKDYEPENKQSIQNEHQNGSNEEQEEFDKSEQIKFLQENEKPEIPQKQTLEDQDWLSQIGEDLSCKNQIEQQSSDESKSQNSDHSKKNDEAHSSQLESKQNSLEEIQESEDQYQFPDSSERKPDGQQEQLNIYLFYGMVDEVEQTQNMDQLINFNTLIDEQNFQVLAKDLIIALIDLCDGKISPQLQVQIINILYLICFNCKMIEYYKEDKIITNIVISVLEEELYQRKYCKTLRDCLVLIKKFMQSEKFFVPQNQPNRFLSINLNTENQVKIRESNDQLDLFENEPIIDSYQFVRKISLGKVRQYQNKNDYMFDLIHKLKKFLIFGIQGDSLRYSIRKDLILALQDVCAYELQIENSKNEQTVNQVFQKIEKLEDDIQIWANEKCKNELRPFFANILSR